MLSLFRLSAVVACVALTQGAAGSPQVAASKSVVVARAADERRPFFPSIERLANGHLIVVYADSPEHVSPRGRISLVKSVDGGRTWASPRVVIDTPDDDRDPSIARTSSGALLLSFFTHREAGGTRTFVARSTDDGETWSPPVPVGTKLALVATSAKIIELDNRELLIPIYGAVLEGERARSTIVRSTDDGRTWPAASESTIAVDPAIDFEEPAIVEVAPKHLVAMARTETPGAMAAFVESLDRGRTWSRPVSSQVAAQGSDLLFVDSRASGGPTVIHAWGDWSERYGEGRPTMLQAWDPARGGFLRPAVTLYHGHCEWGDESYPSSIMADDDTVLTVFYDACAGTIGGRWTKLADLTGVSPR